MKNEKKLYSFCGTVCYSGILQIRNHRFSAETYAVSEAAAKNNILFQYKSSRKIPLKTAGFSLRGNLQVVEEAV